MAQANFQPAFRKEDGLGLAVAIALHVALVAVLALQFLFATPRPFTSDRVTVSLATEVSLESTAPNPSQESRAAIAPTLSDVSEPETTPEESVTEPAASAAPTPPSTRAAPSANRDRTPANRAPPAPTPSPPARTQPTGGSRIGDDFLAGQGSSTNTDDTDAPAATFGRRERAALSSAITRALRPHWSAPTGVDADKLISIVSWRLNEDGTLRGTPTCRTQPSSITASNRPQVSLHCDRAIRAVRRAAPFNLPEQFYSRWDDLEWQFDRRL